MPIRRTPALYRAARFVALGVLMALAGPRPAAAVCPQSCIWTPNGGDFCTSAAKLDTVLAVDPGNLCSGSHDHSSFDAVNSTLAAVSGSPFGGCKPRTTVVDDFTTYNLPPGTPVSLTAKLDLTIKANSLLGPGTVHALLREGASNLASRQWDIETQLPPNGAPYSATLTLPILAVVGTPFHLTYEVGSDLGELCSAEIVGTLSFTDQPGAVGIFSCKGFIFDPLSARPASWGSVKSLYR